MNRRKMLKDKHLKKMKKANLKENPRKKERYFSKAEREQMATRIVSADQFVRTDWKNGLGSTLELAINEGGTIDNFDWRISIADVKSDGPYSSFEGYTRYLTPIEGEGTALTHNDDHCENLTKFETAIFDGGSVTVGKLNNGPIKNFNVIAKRGLVDAIVRASHKHTEILLEPMKPYYCYSPIAEMTLVENELETVIGAGQLLCYLGKGGTIKGEAVVVVEFKSN